MSRIACRALMRTFIFLPTPYILLNIIIRLNTTWGYSATYYGVWATLAIWLIILEIVVFDWYVVMAHKYPKNVINLLLCIKYYTCTDVKFAYEKPRRHKNT